MIIPFRSHQSAPDQLTHTQNQNQNTQNRTTEKRNSEIQTANKTRGKNAATDSDSVLSATLAARFQLDLISKYFVRMHDSLLINN